MYPQVVRIERASYAFPWTEGIFRDCLRVNYFCRVVEIGPTLAGHGIMSVGAAEAHLLNICVAEAYRCRGIGGRLLKHLLRAAALAGAVEAFLEARPSNLSAIRLYQSLGFRADRRAPRLLPGDRRPRGCHRAQARHRLESRALR